LLPPLGFADVRPFSRHSFTQVTAVDAATRKSRPAARAETPPFTVSIKRTRKSSE
jgi:hypothetical protein